MRTALALLLLLASAHAAAAACYADYKAKQDNPLRLQYGVVEVRGGACSAEAANAQLAPVLEEEGWQLLEIIGTFDETGLEERREDAGDYFLRY